MASASALLSGDPPRLGDYWLAGRLGAGGQGVVYEAYDHEGRRFALKVLHGDAATDPTLRSRFGREATAARRVASFCTAPVVAVDLEGPKPYIVSEYVEGPSLRQAVMDGRRFAGDDLHRLATAVATALTAIHDAGVIHRDLKPDNVLLGPDGPRVIDFGVARTLEMSLTASGLITGTPTYMAPEVFTGQRAGPPADVFSWGAIVLFAAAGDDPFKAESLGAVMHRVLSTDPDLDVLPESLRALVGAALEKEPLARPTAQELLLGLIAGFRGSRTELLATGSAEAGLLGAGAADPALGAVAEDAYGFLDQAQRNLVPDLFLRLVTVGDDGEIMLRSASRSELSDGTDEGEVDLRRVLEVFSYLLSGTGDEIALARPALLRAWPRFRAWLDDERDGLPVHRQIRTAAGQWDAQGRREGEVFQGSRLDAALRWAAAGRRHLTLNRLERDFLDACTAATKHRIRRRRLLTVALATLLVLALAGGGTAVWQSRVVSAQRDEALAGDVASQADALRTSDPVRAMLLSVAAWRLNPGTTTRASLASSFAQRERMIFIDPRSEGETVRLMAGHAFVSVSPAGVRTYDLRTGKRTGGWDDLKIGTDRFVGAALSPGGRFLAVAAGHTLRVWDVTTGRPTGARFGLVGPELFTGVEYGVGDRYVEIHQGDGTTLWDTRTGRMLVPRHGVMDAAFRPAGDLVAVADFETHFELLRLPGGAPVARWHASDACLGAAQAVAFSPDGRTLACATRSTISFIDVRTGRSLMEQPPTGWDWNGGRIWFSPDGRFLVAGGQKNFQLIRVADGETLLTYRAGPETVAFDGSTLRYLADDTVVSLDLSDLTDPTRLPGAGTETALFSPDGRLLLSHAENSRSLGLWDVSRRRPAGPSLRVTTGNGDLHPAFSGDGRLVAVVDGVGAQTVRLWDTRTSKQTATITLPGDWYANALTVNSDGTLLAVGVAAPVSEDGEERDELRLWDVRRRHWVKTIAFQNPAEVVFQPRSRKVASQYGSSNRLVDLTTGQAVGPPFGGGGLESQLRTIAFSPDGTLVATGDYTGRLMLWDVRTGRRHGPIFRAHAVDSGIAQIVFSPKEAVAVTIGGDRTVQLWDTAAPRRLGQAISGGGADIETAAFNADGSILHTFDATGVLHDLPIAPDRITAAICTRAARTLSETEWTQYLPGVPYQNPCPHT